VSKGKASAEALTASAATGDPFTYAEAMESPQQDHWKRAMEEESVDPAHQHISALSWVHTVSRSGTSIPRHRNPPRRYCNQSWSEGLYNHDSQTIRHGIYSRCLDTHRSQCKVGLCRGSGGEGIARYQRLLSSRGITNECSTCNAARYLIYGRCSFPLQFAAIYQPYDCC